MCQLGKVAGKIVQCSLPLFFVSIATISEVVESLGNQVLGETW